MRLPDVASIAAFAVFLLAPAASLVLPGYDAAKEGGVKASDVKWSHLAAPDATYRNSLGKQVLTNSPLGIAAIKTKSALDYEVFGFVNTKSVISGIDDWLFYKPGFFGGKCPDDGTIRLSLNRVEAMRAIAEAAGIDYRVSVSPDKEVVYPDMLGWRGVAAAGCKSEAASRWRRLARQTGSSVIDHLQAMDRQATSDLLYFRTDTHWNRLGGAMAMRQLMQLYLQRDPGLPHGSSVEESKTTDLRRMLRLDTPEAYDAYPDYWEGAFKTAAGNGANGAVVVHDSFYASLRSHMKTLFPDGKFFYSFSDEAIQAAVAARPKHVLVNTVERDFLIRVGGDAMSWYGRMGKGLLAANQGLAEGCQMAVIAPSSLKTTGLLPLGDGKFTTGKDAQILVALPATTGRPCLSVSFETSSKTPTQIFLPILDSAAKGGYRAGRSVDLAATEKVRQFTIVLPQTFAGQTMRIDPIAQPSEISNLSISVGSL